MEIWLSNGSKDKIKLPINPETIGYSGSTNHEDIVLANGDEKTILGGRGLRTYTISSFFPNRTVFYTKEKNHKSPTYYVKKIRKWMDNQEVLQLQVTTTVINEQITIRSFECSEKGGSVGDIDYTLELKEYEPVSYKNINGSKPNKPGDGNKGGDRPDSKKPKNRTHIVKKNESLWIIAKKYYKDGSKWPVIYKKNKTIIGKNPNALKLGMKLVIP